MVKKMKLKHSIIIAIMMFSFAGVAFSNTTPASAQPPTIKIGALGPLAITPGADMEKGVKLAVKEINAAGGVDVGGTAHNFELFVETTSGEDSLPDATVAVTNLVKLKTSNEVVAVIGGFRTEVVVGLQLNLGTTPFLGVGSSAPIVSPYFWRVGPTNASQLAVSVIELYGMYLKPLGVSTFTIAREDATWTALVGGGINATLQSTFGLTATSDIVVSQSATQSAVDAAMTAATADGYSDAILTLFSAPVGKLVTQSWASLNMTQYLAGINVEAQKNNYFEQTNGAAYGEIDLETSPPDKNVTVKTGDFKQAYYDEYLELPTYTSFASYDAVFILKEAIERADASDSASIQTALVDTDYVGATFKYAFTNSPIPNYLNSSQTVVAHDLFTTDGVGTDGGEYVNPIFAQWQQNGVKKTIYVSPTDKGGMEWPINHANHTFIPEEPAPTPGFEAPTLVFGLVVFGAITILRKKKK
jgi:branched-chain amino acid transport system substrate-binding protein